MTLTENTATCPLSRSPIAADEVLGLLSSESVVREHEPLARRTTLRVGGNADYWIEPATEEDLVKLLRYAHDCEVPVMMLGRGSNLLVRDGGIRGFVVCLSQPCFCRVVREGNRLRCGAGARLKSVAIEARKQELAGLEFLEGIPGSVGGALRMNAGAHGGSIFEAVQEVRLVRLDGTPATLAGHEMKAGYRSCPMLRTQVAVEAVLVGVPGEANCIEERMRLLNQKRWASQPAAPSAGCIFKNPASIAAGRLVDELGLKGSRVGGARVSLEHGNFIVTESGGRAAEVLELIAQIKDKARTERGIELETEVQIVGEE